MENKGPATKKPAAGEEKPAPPSHIDRMDQLELQLVHSEENQAKALVSEASARMSLAQAALERTSAQRQEKVRAIFSKYRLGEKDQIGPDGAIVRAAPAAG